MEDAPAFQVDHVLQGHGPDQADHVLGEAVGIATTARGKGDGLLLVVTATLVLALVALHPHAEYHLLAIDGEANEVTDAISVLHQMAVPTFGTLFNRSFVATCKIIVLPLYSSRVHSCL